MADTVICDEHRLVHDSEETCDDCLSEMYSQHAPDHELVKQADLVIGKTYTFLQF